MPVWWYGPDWLTPLEPLAVAPQLEILCAPVQIKKSTPILFAAGKGSTSEQVAVTAATLSDHNDE